MWVPGYGAADFGRYVRQQRKAQGMTQGELAEWVGVSRGTIIAFENGSGSVSLDTALKALEILGSYFALAPKGTPASGNGAEGS
ncbi:MULTISPECIES: helix-turn-helix transcriptional regulator [Crystallibacter]|uniref:helix-turn-helix transcriptional regulator n=1 Tax=Crystallibacter TaxID=3456524 RepID=UPI001475B90B|nr:MULTISPECIES: helix-turn-helix domain-containing protein [unclassified Arthrobacter]MCW2131654.1 helix-turn-helix protein [Arthrobacter sp. VKM Ac-2550]NMR28107.1 helix-turn-helix transcriptional regulator [Arthrobacter sp. SF27]